MANQERTLQMKKQFMSLRKKGKTIQQIAEQFNLAPSHVYSLLGEIAEENGVSRDRLLYSPHAKSVCYERAYAPVKPIDADGIETELSSIIDALNQLESEIMSQLEGWDLNDSDK